MAIFKNKYLIILFLLFAVAFFLRFYELENIPAGFLNDEANAGYDAYSILLTGRDQWNNILPLNNFIGFGDFPRPIHRYLLLIPVYLFGLNEFSIRFISAFSGVLSVVALFFLVKKLVNKTAAFFSAFLFAVMPWAIGLSRIGHESNIAIFFLIVALILGLVQKSSKSLYYCVIFLAFAMYTYSAYILYAPIVLTLVLYFNYKKEIGYKTLLKPLILFLIIISPIVFQKNSASVRFSQVGLATNIENIGLINNLNDERGQCLIIFNPMVCKVTDNKAILYTSVFIKNYLSHFSPNFLYISGTSTQFSILPKRGLDYIFNFLPLIFGFVFLLKNNKQKKLNRIFISLFLLAPLPDSLTSDGNYVRASIMQPFIAVVTGLGYYYLINYLINKNKTLKYIILLSIFVPISFSLISFFVVYITYFKNNYAIYSQFGYKNLVTNIKNSENFFDKIYLSSHLNDAKQYIYYLFYTKYDPVRYQQKNDVIYTNEQNGWISIDQIGKIYFVQRLPKVKDLESLPNKSVLLISNPVDFPKSIKAVFVVKDKLGNVIFKAVKLSDLLDYNKTHAILIKKQANDIYQ